MNLFHFNNGYPKVAEKIPYLKLDTFPLNEEKFRPDEVILCSAGTTMEVSATVALDNRYNSKLSAVLRILRTFIVMLILLLGSLYFSQDANKLVLLPIENMMSLVNLIAMTPSIATRLSFDSSL